MVHPLFSIQPGQETPWWFVSCWDSLMTSLLRTCFSLFAIIYIISSLRELNLLFCYIKDSVHSGQILYLLHSLLWQIVKESNTAPVKLYHRLHCLTGFLFDWPIRFEIRFFYPIHIMPFQFFLQPPWSHGTLCMPAYNVPRIAVHCTEDDQNTLKVWKLNEARFRLFRPAGVLHSWLMAAHQSLWVEEPL